jgi:cytochrome c556
MYKPRTLVVLALAVLAAGSLYAADTRDEPVTAEDVIRQMRETLKAAKAYGYEQKDEYRQKLQAVLDKVDRQIDVLSRKAEEGGEEARAKARQQLKELKKVRDKAQKQLDRVKEATPGSWDEVKQGVATAMDDLAGAFSRAAEHFKK